MLQSPIYAQHDDEALNSHLLELYQAGKYSEAVPLAERALAISQKELSPDSPKLAYEEIKPYDPLLHHLTHKDQSRQQGQRAPEDSTFYDRIAMRYGAKSQTTLMKKSALQAKE